MPPKRKEKFTDESITQHIHLLRGQKIMLDRDLANLYDVIPTRLREQVKRNLKRFPKHFMFALNQKEIKFMVSQNAIPSVQHLGGAIPLAFTEHGILMLANVLKTEKALKVSIRIIEIFVHMRALLSNSQEVLLKLEQIGKRVDKHDEDFETVFTLFQKLLMQESTRRRIGFRRADEKEEA
jgi:hypothetical protein